jgi:hypothetical protein
MPFISTTSVSKVTSKSSGGKRIKN